MKQIATGKSKPHHPPTSAPPAPPEHIRAPKASKRPPASRPSSVARSGPPNAPAKKTSSAPNAEPAWEQVIGARIRALREERGITLEQLARISSLTKGQLSRIENGVVSSPVSTLTRIATALAISPGELFSRSTPEKKATFVPANNRPVIVGRGSKLGHIYESLAADFPAKKDFEPYLMTIEEKKIDPKKNTFKHPGQELIFMLKGSMDYRHDTEVFHLTPGDALFFDGQFPHGPVAVFSPPVHFLSIISN